jgi:hypothetical protein
VARRCIFCGDPKTEESHIVPDWLTKLAKRELGLEGQIRWAATEGGVAHPDRSWKDGKVASYALCAKHNRALGALEYQVRPIIVPMILGSQETVFLTEAAQGIAAGWATLMAIMLERTMAEPRAVSDQHRQDFLLAMRPPTGVTVWLGAHVERAPGTFEFQELNDLHDDATPRGWAGIVCIGHLVLVAVGDKDGTDPDLGQVSNLGDFLSLIWPLEGDISWPTRDLGFDQQSLLALSGTLRHVFG